MICPHCSYSHKEFNPETNEVSEGKEGDFYTLPIKLERRVDNFYRDKEEKSIFGCPQCNKIFMEK